MHGNAGVAGGDIRHFERGQIDFGEDRIAQHVCQAAGIIIAFFCREITDIELVGAGEAQQQIGGERALVAFQQRDIAGRNREIFGHHRLGEAKFAAQALKPGAKVERARFHGDIRVLYKLHNFTSIFCKV